MSDNTPPNSAVPATDVDLLETMLAKTADLIERASSADLDLQTPCEEFTVRGLLDHLSTWIQVFDKAANTAPDVEPAPLGFDPMAFSMDEGWADLFESHASSLVSGLRTHGVDRPMTMTADPMPGSMMMAMLLMEYVGHGWDLATTAGLDVPFSAAEVSRADAAARGIIQPEHRGPGFFGPEVVIGDEAPAIHRFVAFLGRTPA